MAQNNIETTDAKDKKGIFVDDLSSLYCEVYAGSPWHQNFDQSEVRTAMEGVIEDPRYDVDLGYDKEGLPSNFLITMIASPDEVIPTFLSNYGSVVLTDTDGIETPTEEDVVAKKETLKSLLEKEFSAEEKILYVIDVGIRPDLQRNSIVDKSSPQRAVVFTFLKVFRKCQNSGIKKALAQTINRGPMWNIVQKSVEHEILDTSPENSEKAHLVFSFLPKVNILKLKI